MKQNNIRNLDVFGVYFRRFIENETTAGVLLLIAAVISIIIATFNGEAFEELLATPFGLSFKEVDYDLTLHQWINDALMAVFFLVVGMEIKREVLVGHLSTPKKALLPVMGALGGMLLPAALYAICNINSPETLHGWGIPMATDIAFAIGILALLGSCVPIALKVFLTALAVADDLGAIIVLAIFYPSHALHFDYLFYATLVMGFLAFYNKFFYYKRGTKTAAPYVICGLLLWFFIYKSGIHATISGVLLAMMIPARVKVDDKELSNSLRNFLKKYEKVTNNSGLELATLEEQQVIMAMNHSLKDYQPMLHRFEEALSPISSFIIMPIFALTNANVALDFSAFAQGVPASFLGIFCGLFFGKPFGIFLMSLLAIKLGLATKPEGCTYKQFFAVAILGGIGFTMSIFVNSLAFAGDQHLTDIGKMSILITSVLVALVGYIAVKFTCKK